MIVARKKVKDYFLDDTCAIDGKKFFLFTPM